jgi:hypothetical protein
MVEGWKVPKSSGRRRRLALGILAAVGLVALTAACQTSPQWSYTGALAQPDNRLVIEDGGPHPVRWENRDLILDYEYEKSPDQIRMLGRVALQDGNAKFPAIKRMHVDVHFLDANGLILDTGRLWTSGFWEPMILVNWSFDRTWAIPAGTSMIGFSYSGTVGEQGSGPGKDDGGGGVEWDFWQGP